MGPTSIPRRRSTDIAMVPPPQPEVEDFAPIRSSVTTRLSAFAVLVGLVAAVGYIGRQAYLAATDSFVAPLILSPDNDLVLAHKQKVIELEVQRSLARANLEGVEADVAAMEVAEQQLARLQSLATDSMRFTNVINSRQATDGSADLQTLQAQHALLEEIQEQQREITGRAAKSYQASLITRGEYEKEVQALRQAELNLLENSRAQARARAAVGQVLLGRAPNGKSSGPVMPELAMRETQIAQVELEVVRIQSEKRAKLAEKRVLTEKVQKIEELEVQLKGRPVFRAMEKSLHAAFVPYTQIEDLAAGAEVYQCLWGVLSCRLVGKVSEIVPGEVTMPDPWGNPARGQFILLELQDPKAATAKVLRVREAAVKPGAGA